MNTNRVVDIQIKAIKNGRLRATYLNRSVARWMPMPLEDAMLAVATGAGRLVAKSL